MNAIDNTATMTRIGSSRTTDQMVAAVPSRFASIYAARARDWATLRPYDAPWPEHPAYR